MDNEAACPRSVSRELLKVLKRAKICAGKVREEMDKVARLGRVMRVEDVATSAVGAVVRHLLDLPLKLVSVLHNNGPKIRKAIDVIDYMVTDVQPYAVTRPGRLADALRKISARCRTDGLPLACEAELSKLAIDSYDLFAELRELREDEPRFGQNRFRSPQRFASELRNFIRQVWPALLCLAFQHTRIYVCCRSLGGKCFVDASSHEIEDLTTAVAQLRTHHPHEGFEGSRQDKTLRKLDRRLRRRRRRVAAGRKPAAVP